MFAPFIGVPAALMELEVVEENVFADGVSAHLEITSTHDVPSRCVGHRPNMEKNA
jgi:hypothetical protein